MADALTQFWQGLGNLLTGNQQQQPISSSQAQSSGQTPTQAPAMPQQPGGLEGLLNSPITQGILGSYFSLLAQPKVGGWGRGLGNAGLSGLQAYEGARAEQAKLPLEQAQLGQAQAETKLKGAEVGQKEAETQFYQQHPEAAGYKYAPEYQKSQQRELAAQQFEQKAVVDPVNAGQWRTAATLVRSGEDPDKAMTAAFTDPTLAGREGEAKIKFEQAATGQAGKAKPEWAVDENGNPVVLREGAPLPSGPVHRLGAEGRPNYKTYTDSAGQIHTIDVNTEMPDPKWVPYGKPAADKGPEYKTYSDPAGKTHTIDVRKDKPDPSWVPYSKPTMPKPGTPGAAEGKAAGTLKSLEATYEKLNPKPIGYSLGRGADEWNAGFGDYVRQHGLDPNTGRPLGATSAAGGPTEAELAEHPGAAWHPELGAHGELVLPDGTHVPFTP